MRIIFTGGGTAGHILPNIALLSEIKSREPSHDFAYIGGQNGSERVIAEQHGVKFYGITTGKLRRYFSWENFMMPMRVSAGFFQSLSLLKRLDPDVIFSKGGYVSVPVVLAAWSLRIPVILHESDISVGLANKICARFVDTMCVAWAETEREFAGKRVLLTGIPIRPTILRGDRQRGLRLCDFNGKKPVLLAMGGSLGASFLNELVEKMLPHLLKVYDIVHVTGRGKNSARAVSGYKVFEYLDEELADIYAATHVVLGRAGANSLAEIGALKKPSVLIPLGTEGSRGDQILNAQKFQEMGAAVMILQKKATPAKVEKVLVDLAENSKRREEMGEHAYEFGVRCVRAAEVIADLVCSATIDN